MFFPSRFRPSLAAPSATVKGIEVSGAAATAAVAGDTVELGLAGSELEESFVRLGAVLCHEGREVPVVRKLRATILA